MSKVPAKKSKQVPKQKKQPPSLVKRAAEAVGAHLGSLVGLKDLGRDAGSWLSRVTGFGDYTLHQNSFMKSSAGVPQFEYLADGSVIVTHKEYVRDIVGSVDFAYTTLDIVPTNDLLFIWLKQIAGAYEQFEFMGLIACYVPTSGDAIASTNNALGTVIMATEYDLSRPPFLSKSEMDQYMFVTSEKPSEPQLHPIECNPKRDILNARYLEGNFRTQSAAVDSTASSASFPDIERNLRCLGRLQVATIGQQAVTTVGELWLTYKVKFSKPRGSPPGANGGFLHASGGTEVLSTGSTTLANAVILSNSTAGANGVGINTARTGITLYGLRPQTVVNVILTVEYLSGTGTYAYGAVTPTSADYLSDYYNNGVNSTGVASIVTCDGTTATTPLVNVQQMSLVISDESYLTPAAIVWANPTITAATTWKWDLRVYIRPRNGVAVSTALASSLPEQLFRMSEMLSRLEKREHEDEKYVSITQV